MADRGCREPVSRAPIQSGHKISDRASERPRLPGRHLAGSRPQDKAVGPGWGVAQSYGGVRPLAYALSFGSDGTGLQGGRELRSNRAACASAVRVGRDRSMDETTVLDNVLQQAHVVHAGSVNGGGVVGEIRVDLSDLVESARLRTAMAVESLPGFNCMCLGDVRFEVFDRTGERLAVVVLHHGATLRWEAWESDAVLADGRLLLAWLDGHGMPGPLLQFEADRLREQEWTVEERNWQAAMPAGLEGLADRILGLSRTGGSPAPELLAELTDRLHLIFPDPVERVLALLGWYGSGSGRCSGFPVHEGVPGELLGRVPIADLLAALADPRAEERHDAGAVRHLVGWKTRPRQKRDVARLPEPLRARLLAHARRCGDSDKQARADRWLAPSRV